MGNGKDNKNGECPKTDDKRILEELYFYLRESIDEYQK